MNIENLKLDKDGVPELVQEIRWNNECKWFEVRTFFGPKYFAMTPLEIGIGNDPMLPSVSKEQWKRALSVIPNYISENYSRFYKDYFHMEANGKLGIPTLNDPLEQSRSWIILDE